MAIVNYYKEIPKEYTADTEHVNAFSHYPQHCFRFNHSLSKGCPLKDRYWFVQNTITPHLY